MRNNVSLTVASLLTIILLTLHLTDDFLHLEPPGRTGTLIVVCLLAAFLYGTVELAGRRSGYIITLLTSIAGVGCSSVTPRSRSWTSGRFSIALSQADSFSGIPRRVRVECVMKDSP